MGKKYMKKEGNKVSIFKIEKIPIFAHDAPKFGFGDIYYTAHKNDWPL